MAAMTCLLTDRNEISNPYKGFLRCFLPSFGSFGKSVSEVKIFRNQPTETRITYGDHV